MRCAVLLLLAALLPGIPAAAAQGSAGAPGAVANFSICAFNFEGCVPLTDAAAQARGVSADETAMIDRLRRLAADLNDDVIDEIRAAFGPPRRPGPPDLWFPDLRDEHAACIDCGLHLIVLNERLVQINWGVQGRFRVIYIAPAQKGG
jgi:hypothetical protein